ncbi:aspartic endopeptidase [Durotheca rogersii]|uniref:aspartic endopeptidase n=1 Tax=Durotheca rogersii TaxID=419775 RepID=UPI00222094D6|nr:aspartic endopeptidase [Durotheca rogersii]KAI5860202.1 aspartic endopeptidase [Durotheca rogersii]
MEHIYSVQDSFKQDRDLSKVDVIHNTNYQRHGTKSYVHSLSRFGFQPTLPGPYFHVDRVNKVEEGLRGAAHTERALVKKVGNAEPTPITAEDLQNDSMYLCIVKIGTPPQAVLLNFDTGSADTWVFSTHQGQNSRSGHNVFDPNRSTSFKVLPGKAWRITYGDGSYASGDCGSDTLMMGGLAVEGQTIECAIKASGGFTTGTGDGLLGLAWSKINMVTDSGTKDPQHTPVENMIRQHDIPKEAELFTSAFYSVRDAAPHSFYTFGFIDQDLVKKSGHDIHWTPVDNSKGFWSVPSESFAIDGANVSALDNTAVVDTGTTLALLSDSIVKKLYNKIPGAAYDYVNQGYVFPVGTKAEDLPEFKVSIGNKKYVVQKEHLAFATTDDKANWYGGVQSRGDLPHDVLGNIFLQNVYAIWDQGNRRLGLVPKIEARQNLRPPPDSSASAGGGDGGKKERVNSITLLSRHSV